MSYGHALWTPQVMAVHVATWLVLVAVTYCYYDVAPTLFIILWCGVLWVQSSICPCCNSPKRYQDMEELADAVAGLETFPDDMSRHLVMFHALRRQMTSVDIFLHRYLKK